MSLKLSKIAYSVNCTPTALLSVRLLLKFPGAWHASILRALLVIMDKPRWKSIF